MLNISKRRIVALPCKVEELSSGMGPYCYFDIAPCPFKTKKFVAAYTRFSYWRQNLKASSTNCVIPSLLQPGDVCNPGAIDAIDTMSPGKFDTLTDRRLAC